ncbi:MAG TPA: 30S ribosome-binding factor RbfA [Bacteroidota bacterium]|nr:30S ribosome-binding factor RbfA [Bacteroidota bacterium]
MSVRTEKVASLVKEELGTIFQRTYNIATHGLVTVTEVQMSPDLRVAKVFVSVFSDDVRKKRTMELIEQSKSSIRSALGRAVKLRFVPELIFYNDETLDRAFKLENIFNKIHEHDADQKQNNDSNAA